MKVVCIVGPPGAGKTSLVNLLAAYGSVFRLRKEVAAAELVDQNGIAKDWIDVDVVRQTFATFIRQEAQKGTKLVVCDNFPGNGDQVNLVRNTALTHQISAVLLVQLDIDAPLIAARLAQRRVCNTCEQDPLNDPRAPALGNDTQACVRCGTSLRQRPNDQGAKLQYRITRYYQSLPAIQKQCRLNGIPMHCISAAQETATIAGIITELLGESIGGGE